MKSWQYPTIRFDPLTMRLSQIEALSLKKIAGQRTYVSAIRSKRPMAAKPPIDISPSTQEPCEYCQIIQGADYSIPVVVVDRLGVVNTMNNLFVQTPSKYDFTDTHIISIINKYPAMVRYIENPLCLPNLAHGVCLVIFPTVHYHRFLDLPANTLTNLLLTIQESQRLIVDQCQGKVVPMTTQGRHVETIPIDVFFNIGSMVGGTIDHIHAQLYADLSDIGHSTAMEQQVLNMQDKKRNCIICQVTNRETQNITDFPQSYDQLRIAENTYGSLFANFAPTSNYQLHILPQRHVRFLPDFTVEELKALTQLLYLAFIGLDYLEAPSDRNIRITQLPAGYDSDIDFHAYWSVDPYDSFGGFERSGDQKIAKIVPERLASLMRHQFLKMGLISSDSRINSAKLARYINI